jgi:uncharacterized SAM-dependent methyltransferase
MSKVKAIADRIEVWDLSDGLPQGYPEASIRGLVEGLTARQKYIPAEFSYDDLGSLYFDRFVDSAEYYLPKKELEIFHAQSHTLAELTGPCDLFEVGAGSSKKMKVILTAYCQLSDVVYFHPIDINEKIMVDGARSIVSDLPQLHVRCLVGAYSDVFQRRLKKSDRRALFMLIGSSISQEGDDALLLNIRQQLDTGDFFLISFDLQKQPDILKGAYQNYEASMCSRNVLDHLNTTFASSFEQSLFDFEVQFNPIHKGCETHLRSKQQHTVELRSLNLRITFDKDETIRTGTQRKFNLEEMRRRLASVGFDEVTTFTDQHKWYVVMLLRVGKQ